MRAVLNSASATPFVKAIAAAYMNSVKLLVAPTIYDVADLILMWNNGPSVNYQPVPGANWGTTEILSYLATTWNP
jgi:hypothetical protein